MDIEYRHPTEADAEAMIDVINRSTRELRHHVEDTVENMRTWLFGEKDFDPAGYLIGFDGDTPVAFGGSMISKSRFESGIKDAQVSLFIVPELRGKGIEEHIFNLTAEYLRARGIESLRYWAPEPSGWRNDFAIRQGMKDIRHGYLMICDKPLSSPTPALPDGYSLSRKNMLECSDDELKEFIRAFNDSFQDHWNFSAIPEDRFIKVRDETIKAKDGIYWLTTTTKGGEIAGVCFYAIELRYNEQNNKKAGWTNILGVKKPHRRLGLGRALLTDSMTWLRGQGMDILYLGMEAQNSKALSLYLSMGYRVEQENVHYELKL
ncbi:MAG: GNAT family N-acetyltransferase [Thermoplasmata archaeon]